MNGMSSTRAPGASGATELFTVLVLERLTTDWHPLPTVL